MEGKRPMAYRVFIVDDNAQMREGYALILEDEPALTLCGSVGSAAEALSHVPEVDPDVVLVDVSLPDMNGIELVRALSAQKPERTLLVVSGHQAAAYASEARAAGAHGYLAKDDLVLGLLDAIEEAVTAHGVHP